MTKDTELALSAFFDSIWFKGGARLAMLAACAISGWIGVTLGNVDKRLDVQEEGLTSVQSTLAVRTQDNESFQASVDRDLTALKGGLIVVQQDVATIKGILVEMRRQDVADSLRTDE